MMWWLPELELNQDAVVVRNAWRTHLIDWRQITRLSGRWGVELILSDNSSVQASAAPRIGGIAAGLAKSPKTVPKKPNASFTTVSTPA